MGNRIPDDYTAMRNAGVGIPDSAAALIPELPADSATAVGQEMELSNAPNVAAPTNYAVLSQTAVEHFAQRARQELGDDLTTASVRALALSQAMSLSATDAAPDTLRVTPDGIDIPNLDQALTHARDLAAGRYVENLEGLNGILMDVKGLGAAFASTWGAMQQGWFGWRVGEPWSDILHRRLWPTVPVPDDEGVEQDKAVVIAAAEAGMNRVLALNASLNPLMVLPGYREMVKQSTQAAREDVAQVVGSEWHQNILTGRDVMEHNIAGYGNQWDLGVNWKWSGVPLGFDNMLPLPKQGTPEREATDARIKTTMDSFYADAVTSLSGKASMAGIVFGGLAADFVEDPLLPVGEAAPTIVDVARRALAASSRARGTAAIAMRSGGLDDTIRALDDAVLWVKSATKKASKYPNDPDYQRHVAQAQRNLVRIKAQNERFAQGTIESMLVTDLPQANPRLIAKVGRVYLESNPEQAPEKATTLMMNLQREADVRVAVSQRRVDNPLATDDPALFAEHLRLSRKEQDEVRKTTEWLENKLERADASRLEGTFEDAIVLDKPYAADDLIDVATFHTESSKPLPTDAEVASTLTAEDIALAAASEYPQAHLSNQMKDVRFADIDEADAAKFIADREYNSDVVSREILRNIRRGVAEGAPEEELMQWELTFQMLNDGTISPQQASQRVTGLDADAILKADIMSSRLAAQSKTPTTLANLTLEDEPATLWNRITAGPDAGEQAGNAAMKLAAGADMDDVSMRAMTVDTYLNSYAQRPRGYLGMDDAENVWLGRNAFVTEREAAEWQRSIWEKASDLFVPGLYPEVWNMRPTGALAMARETGWALESVNPRLMRRLENAMAAQEFEQARMLGFFESEFRSLGIFSDTKAGGKLLKRTVDSQRARHFGHIMNQTPDSPEYFRLMQNLNPSEMRSVRRMREMFDFMGDKQGLRNTDRRLTGYITHAMDDSDFPAGTIDPVWQGIPADETIFMPFQEWRFMDAGGLEIDITKAVDRYIRAASKKIHMEPFIHDLRKSAAAAYAADPNMAWFNSYADQLIDVLKGRPSVLGSLVENMAANQGAWRRSVQLLAKNADDPVRGLTDKAVQIPGDMLPMSTKVRERMHGAVYIGSTMAYMGALTGNRRYFPMAISTGLATSGARYGWFRQLEGILRLGNPENQALFKASGLDRHFYKLLDADSGADTAKIVQKVSELGANAPFGAPSINFSENVIRGWAFNAGMSELMTRTGYRSIDEVARAGLLNSYISEAAFATQNLNHRFGLLGRPPWMRRITESGTTAATQFLTFPYKQWETVAWLSRKNPGYLARYMAFSGAITRFGNAQGVDLGQYVSVPGISDFDTKSILTELITTSFGLASSSLSYLTGTGSEKDVFMYTQRLGEQAQNLVPLMNAIKSWSKSSRQIQGGEDRRAGQLIRDLDLGMFEWNEEVSFAENMSNLPLGFFSEEGGFGTDMASIMSGLRSTNANVEKAQYDAARKALQRTAFYRGRIADELDYAIETGDDREFERVLNRAIEEKILPPDMRQVAKNVAMNHGLPRLLRIQADQTYQLAEVLEAIRANSPYGRDQ